MDLPSPDSPTTIKLNSKPFFTAFLYTCNVWKRVSFNTKIYLIGKVLRKDDKI